MERDSLFAKFKLMKMWLKHYHYDVFEPFEVEETGIDTTDSGPLRFNFITNNAGEISSMKSKIEPALKEPIEFKRKPNTITVDNAILKTYTGEFELAGTIIKFYIKHENTLYLIATIPGDASSSRLFRFLSLSACSKSEHHRILRFISSSRESTLTS